MLLPCDFAAAFRIRYWMTLIALVAGVGLPTIMLAASENAPRLEYQVKAGYLFNFLRFTEWPPSALPPGAPYRIGIAGDNAAFTVIGEALQGKTLNNRSIEVLALSAGDPVEGCHLIFVPRSATDPDWNFETQPRRGAVLMVGETENYALRSGMIGFVMRGHNIRFQVNLSAAQQAGLKLSGRLASLAEIVRPKSP